MSHEVVENYDSPPAVDDVKSIALQKLVANSVPVESLINGDVRFQSVLYMDYWYHRLHNNPKEQLRIKSHLEEYLGKSVPDTSIAAGNLLSDPELQETAQAFVETIIVPTKTVDLVITRQSPENETEVLALERDYYPLGLALPGGIILDSDESNDLGIPQNVFAALRVAGTKVLGLGEDAQYSIQEEDGKKYYMVHGESASPAVKIYPVDESGYSFRENVRTTLRPADPRHIVDTVGFKSELVGEPAGPLVWRKKSDIMSRNEEAGGFAFNHHREIVSYITSQTSVDKERAMSERDFVRSLINNPLEVYRSLRNRFEADGAQTSFPELFPVVDKLFVDMFSDEINQMCEQTPLLAGVRDKAVISLRQVALKNRTFLPYLPTLMAITESVTFFDLVARQKKGFYDDVPKDRVIEHNPAETPFAQYHMYRYKYRFDQLMGMVPDEIVIPTFQGLSATDLMKVRGVPVRFVGVEEDFVYVDEFEQSPEEFLMHDANHSWRMIMEDRDYMAEHGMTIDEFTEASSNFAKDYLDKIKILKTDTEVEREMKKLKKIILFEVVHEDARPFLPDVIAKYIQMHEGGAVPFEVPRVDNSTGYMDVVDILDNGISTLSYVRNKLQHGFYDHIDAQLPQIVDPKYRTADWIAKAAYEMLEELNGVPVDSAELDLRGNVSYEWLLKRACAAGPDNIHEAVVEDPSVAKFGDGAGRLNPKRYQAKSTID